MLDSLGTLGSPEERRSNSDSPVTPPTAVAKASTTATSHTPMTARERRPTNEPRRCIRAAVGARCLAVRRLTRDSLPAVSTSADDDLFAASRGGTPAGGADLGSASLPPLAARMRPRSLEEVRGQGDVLRPGSPLRRLIDGSAGAAGPLSAIIWGPPGTGKTTLAHLVATAEGRRFEELSAVTAGVKDVRAVLDRAARERDLYDRQTVLFLDEIHRFTKAQQDALLPGVESRLVILVAATTENPSFSVIAPLLSRSMLITLATAGRRRARRGAHRGARAGPRAGGRADPRARGARPHHPDGRRRRAPGPHRAGGGRGGRAGRGARRTHR